MRYAPRQYAEALYESLQGKIGKDRVAVLQRFDVLLQKNRDMNLKNLILLHVENLDLKKQGKRKVDIESAKPLDSKTKKEIEHIIGTSVLMSETVKPELLAGITILLDDSLYIDASAKSKIAKLFK